MIEGTKEADEQAGERGADCKALTGTLKNYLFVFFFSSNAVKLGFHGSKHECLGPLLVCLSLCFCYKFTYPFGN